MKNHPILIYSPFAGGKTSFIQELVRVLLERLPEGSRARLYTAETYDSVTDERIEVWQFNTRDNPFETMNWVCDGFWPADPLDPTSRMQPPTAATFAKYPISIIEGIATAAGYITGDYAVGGMADRIGKGESVGPSDAKDGPVRLVDGTAAVGGLSRSNIYFAQQRMTNYVTRSLRKPGGYQIWTTHEDDAKEKKQGIATTGQTIIGPEVVGSALTLSVGKHFGNVWRIVGVPLDFENGGETRRVIERRLYLKDHICPVHQLMAKCRNSGGLPRQDSIPDYVRLTDPEKPGSPRAEAAKIVVEKVGL